ncbi:hypothetical protein [Mycobacterium sp. 1274761.0]|uniref:hypothetical protein n=1 Tax=Mycobacterium sp. 1274761.0 TaxID=1834077 RepID=UPI000B21EA47|nr:hypothetical protein [Mycobacterium sp. 1274761.0]
MLARRFPDLAMWIEGAYYQGIDQIDDTEALIRYWQALTSEQRSESFRLRRIW